MLFASPKLKKILAAPAGFLSGIAGGITGVSAPVILMYLTAIDLSREAFIFAISFSLSRWEAGNPCCIWRVV